MKKTKPKQNRPNKSISADQSFSSLLSFTTCAQNRQRWKTTWKRQQETPGIGIGSCPHTSPMVITLWLGFLFLPPCFNSQKEEANLHLVIGNAVSYNAFAHTEIAGVILCAAGHKAADGANEGADLKTTELNRLTGKNTPRQNQGADGGFTGPAASEKQKCLPKCCNLEMTFLSQLLQWILAVFSCFPWEGTCCITVSKQSPQTFHHRYITDTIPHLIYLPL